MKKTFFTIGPTELFPGLEKYISGAIHEDILSVSHRGEYFSKLYKSTTENLKKLLSVPKEYEVFFLSSGTEAMERIIQNTVEKVSLHFINGSFSKRFYETAKELGKEPQKIEVESGENFDFKKISISREVELICFTQNETSTGIALAMEDIYRVKKKYPEKLIAVDIVSSVPYVSIDYNFTDCVFFSVQKGFGLPSGLGVLIVSPAALKKAKKMEGEGISLGSYHSFLTLKKFADKYQTPETPNIFLLYLFNKVLKKMNTIGIKNIREDIEKKSQLLYTFFNEKAYVKNKKDRSKTTIVIDIKNPKKVIEKLAKKGLIISDGYGQFKNSHIRIGNFPSHSLNDIKKLIRAFS